MCRGYGQKAWTEGMGRGHGQGANVGRGHGKRARAEGTCREHGQRARAAETILRIHILNKEHIAFIVLTMDLSKINFFGVVAFCVPEKKHFWKVRREGMRTHGERARVEGMSRGHEQRA